MKGLRSPGSSSRDSGPLLYLLPGTLLLHYLRFGYHYGSGDQDEMLPYLLHRLHPELFTNDWFVQTLAAEFNIRYAFTLLLQGAASVFPVWGAVLLVYVFVFLAVTGAVYKIAHQLTSDKVAAAASTLGVLVMTPQWTLGGNDIAASMLVPSMVGWSIGLWGVYFYLRARITWSAILLGIATWFHLLVGLQLAGLLCLLGAWHGYTASPSERSFRKLLRFAGFYVVCALPVLGPIAYDQLSSTASPPPDSPSLFYIMARFRLPFHYLPSSFSSYSVPRFALLASTGLLTYFSVARSQLKHRSFVERSLASIGVLCLLAFLFTEVVPLLFIAKLQLFKLTVFAKLLLVVVLAEAIVDLLPERLPRFLEQLMAHQRGLLAGVFGIWILVGVGLATDNKYLHAHTPSLTHEETSIGRVEDWARTHTTKDALFAIPPSLYTFRPQARRAAVVTFMSFPFKDRHIYTWFDRITTVAPISLPHPGGYAARAALDSSYHHQSASDWRALAARYDIDYLLRQQTPSAPPLPFPKAFSSGPWTVFRLPR